MSDKRLLLSNFGSSSLCLNVCNGAIPLNVRPKLPPYVVFSVMYEFFVVCVLY